MRKGCERERGGKERGREEKRRGKRRVRERRRREEERRVWGRERREEEMREGEKLITGIQEHSTTTYFSELSPLPPFAELQSSIKCSNFWGNQT
jgi:hypothetical protein